MGGRLRTGAGVRSGTAVSDSGAVTLRVVSHAHECRHAARLDGACSWLVTCSLRAQPDAGTADRTRGRGAGQVAAVRGTYRVMLLWTDPAEVPDDLPATSLTIGTFDGVHAGHRVLLDRVVADADAGCCRSPSRSTRIRWRWSAPSSPHPC